MDEIEYKLNTNNSVLIVNAIDKLISVIKSKYKPAERQKFVLENEELKFLREKCSSKQRLVSLTACQGLLALVELGVLEIAHTMSTVVTLLPSAHNYSAIISTMSGLLILDLRSRLVPGQPYRCQFGLRSPQHPFITVIEKNKEAEEEVLTQMHALCTHPDYVVSSNSLELLRPVFLWLTSHPERGTSLRPWRLLLSLPSTAAQADLLLACVSCQQINKPELVEGALAACSAVADAAVYQQQRQRLAALLPLLARVSNELVRHGRDPRACYTAIERGFAAEAGEARAAAGLAVGLLAHNLGCSAATHLHELFTLCLNIISKYEYSTICLSTFAALSLQWLHLPSLLTASALKTASKILDIQRNMKQDSRLYLPNLKANKTFHDLLYTDSRLTIVFKLNQTWERVRDDEEKFKKWMDSIQSVDDVLKIELLPFLFGVIMEHRQEAWYVDVVLKALGIAVSLVDFKKEVSVQLLPILLYKLANDSSPNVKLECLKALPLMAKTKENVPTIVSIFNKLKTNKGVPTSFLIMLYTRLAETQVRCFPYLQELLAEAGAASPDDLKWEIEIARAVAVKRICETRPSPQGLELVSVISATLNRCSSAAGAVAAAEALRALAALWRHGVVAPPSAWRALRHKLPADTRSALQAALCELLAEVPALRAATAEYSALVGEAAQQLWALLAGSHQPRVAEAACDALAHYRLEDYTLKDIPEIYRRTVKLPSSYCKTPADAARKPEDVLDYVPCEVWPEVFRCTNQAALAGVGRLAGRLLERELRGYRGGVYSARGEPATAEYLPASSIVRGLLECCRKQLTYPSFEYPDAVLISMLSALGGAAGATASGAGRALPPLQWGWLGAAAARGAAWRPAVWRVAARAPQPSARRLVDAFLNDLEEGKLEESEIIEVFELLPTLCRTMPPNSLRGPLQTSLHLAYQDTLQYKPRANITHFKSTDQQPSDAADLLFPKLMELIRTCLECDKIHEANRTLLSQIVESYFIIIDVDSVAWAALEAAACALGGPQLERLTAPGGWWEAPPAALRRAAAARARRAAGTSLTWLNDIIDAHAGEIAEQQHSLQCMLPALRAAGADADGTRDWLLQLMARAQVAFQESADDAPKLYYCDVFALSALAFSGLWCLEPEAGTLGARHELLAAALAQLAARAAWRDTAAQMLEWLCHTRDASPSPALALACRRAVLALRHEPPFAQPRIWTRLETYFGRNMNIDE